MSDVWAQFGFRSTPYRFTPLEANDEDVSLHVGRELESSQFLTQVDQLGGGIIVISGDIGLGKTSFLNVQQYLLGTGQAGVGPRLLINPELTSIANTDNIETLAQRIVHNLIVGIEAECLKSNKSLPKLAAQIKQWMSHEGFGAGFSFGFEAFDFGLNVERRVSAPAVSEAKLENWKEILEFLVLESRKHFNLDGVLLCIDNTETLAVSDLVRILMFFRDTIFSVDNIWWVIVGQRDLYAEIDRHDRRVSQRMRGTGIEIEPLTSEELHELVERRIQHLRSDTKAKSPLSRRIHDLLYEASCGQPRYMLKTADTLFIDIITSVRMYVLDQQKKHGKKPQIGAPEFMQEMMTRRIQGMLVDREVPDELAESLLRKGAVKALRGKKLPVSLVDVLKRLGEHEDGIDLAILRGDTLPLIFDEEIVRPLESADLIYKIDEGDSKRYRLKGDAWLCNRFESWDDIAKGPQRNRKR